MASTVWAASGLNLSSSSPTTTRTGISKLAEAFGERGLDAGPHSPQRSCQARGRVRKARRPVGLLLGQVSEEWSGEPVVEELGHHGVTATFELGRAAVRLGVAQPPARLVGDARVRPDDDEALDEARRLERQVQAAPAPERVADVSRPAARFAESPCGLDEARAASGIGERP